MKHTQHKRRSLYARTVDAMTSRVQESPRETAARIRWLTNFRRPRVWISCLALVLALALGIFCLAGRRENPVAVQPDPIAPVAADAPIEEAVPASGRLNLLLVGTDDSGETMADSMTDMIAYLRWDCDTGAMQILQIPRDLYVGDTLTLQDGTIYVSANMRINSIAASNGGMAALCRVVNDQLGLPIDGYLCLDYAGLSAIVDTLGGVEVDVPMELDSGDGSYLPAGRNILDGASVEYMMRVRKVYGNGDLGRQQMQRAVYAGLLRYARTCTLIDAAKLAPVLARYLSTDLDLPTLISVAAAVEKVQAGNVTFAQLPLYSIMTAQSSVLLAPAEETATLLDGYFRDAPGGTSALHLAEAPSDAAGQLTADQLLAGTVETLDQW